MQIPKAPMDRLMFYSDVVDKCTTWLPNLKAYYTTLRGYYEAGASAESASPIFNNIYPHIDLVTSMLYAMDTTRFSVQPDATESAAIFDKCPIVARRIQQEWHDSNCDMVAGEAVRLALIFQTSLIKLIVRNKEVHPYVVDPEMFGVLREDTPFLDRQQACVQKYQISWAALGTMLQDHPKRDELMNKIVATKTDETRKESGLDRILVSATTPNIVGQAMLPWVDLEIPLPQVDEPLVDMHELYVWDDDKGDYRVVTMAAPAIVIYERHCADVFVKGELPFVQFCPNPKSDNWRGESEVGRLRPLQDLLSERLRNIRKMLNRQADPPKVGSGLMGPADEIAMALSDPASFTNADTNYNLKELSPTIPQDLFAEVDRILAMFEQTSGLTPALQGRGSPGVRSGGQFAEMARFGSSRIKKRALIIEDSIEKLATLIFKVLRKYSDDVLIDSQGKPFLLAQMPDDCSMKVDAHSSSPAFMEDTKQMAFALYKAQAIDGEDLIDMIAPPNADMLKMKLRKRSEAAAADRAKKEAQGLDPDAPPGKSGSASHTKH